MYSFHVGAWEHVMNLKGFAMEELFQLRTYIEQQRYTDALNLLGEMEEMSKDDKINKILSFIIVLLIHLIKQQSAGKTTRSWDLAIYNAVTAIQRVNKRRKAGGYYLMPDELRAIIAEAYIVALKNAAQEAFEGIYSDEQLGKLVNRVELEQQALELILTDS
jgi:hypothetical protein